ncbi:DNA-directed RNA polymerase III subunit RPC2 [Dictyocoela muelleri]|nr:DNA-directed RNA polymerase III subunit RPC2 [Dictyocoela muelleri]
MSQQIKNFIKHKGLTRQQVSSFNSFISSELPSILKANNIVDSVIDPTFYLKYNRIWVDKPMIEEHMNKYPVYPNDCRIRNMTYSGNVYVDIEYVKNKSIVKKRDVFIGKIPVMLRSDLCHLKEPDLILSNESQFQRNARMGECPLDPGGYFIINGTEKVILMQEQLSKNRIIVDIDPKLGLNSQVTSSTHDRKSKTLIVFKQGALFVKNNSLKEDIPFCVVMRALDILNDMEICSYVGTEPEILEIFLPTLLVASNLKIYTNMQALEYIKNFLTVKTVDEARVVVTENILPNIPVEELSCKRKGIYLGIMARRLLLAKLNLIEPDDRDFIGNKRFEPAGALLSILFEDTFKRYNDDLKKSIDKVLSKRYRAQEFDVLTFMNLQSHMVTMAFEKAITSGKWNLKRFRMERSGVTETLSRLSYIASLGMMTRVCSQFEKTRKISGPRALNTSSWGMLCPADTPEGESCGLVKNLSLLAEITTETSNDEVRKILYDLGVVDIIFKNENIYKNQYLVFLNGLIIGVIRDGVRIIENFRRERRMGKIDKYVSICIHENHKSIYVSSDSGRICRPLIIVDKNNSIVEDPDWEMKIEYLDVNELTNCRVALNKNEITENTTHLEIDPYAILGYVASLIPYPHHNQSPRNTYQCAMGKQAIGALGYNQKQRFDSNVNILSYPQKPLVSTKNLKLTNYEKLPAGVNAMVAVMSFSGYDIEDALIFNKNSLQRGIGRCEVYKTVSVALNIYSNGQCDVILPFPEKKLKQNDKRKNEVENLKNEVENQKDEFENQKDEFENQKDEFDNNGESFTDDINNPEEGESIYDELNDQKNNDNPCDDDYSKIIDNLKINDNLNCEENTDPKFSCDGIISPGTRVFNGTILVNKFTPVETDDINNDSPVPGFKFSGLRHKGDPCVVDRVVITKSGQDKMLLKVNLRQMRNSEIGDKFSSRHGQKGVIGNIVEQVDMPFTEDGVTPDIIMNPHGFPSRMTVGKMIELLAGKAGICEGKQEDGTAFSENRVEEFCEILRKNGFNFYGKDVLYSGISGEIIPVLIFFGPVFYQKLKHMVADKIHARPRGKRTLLTRQPTEGRSRDGGLRLGEMERDCLISYGASSLIQERLMLSSDAYDTFLCTECGFIGNKKCCGIVKAIKIPYAFKLLVQELISMNVYPKIGYREP